MALILSDRSYDCYKISFGDKSIYVKGYKVRGKCYKHLMDGDREIKIERIPLDIIDKSWAREFLKGKEIEDERQREQDLRKNKNRSLSDL